jgi:hypothetical protein
MITISIPGDSSGRINLSLWMLLSSNVPGESSFTARAKTPSSNRF